MISVFVFVKTQLFAVFDMQDLLNCRLVQKQWYKTLHDDALIWRQLIDGGPSNWRQKVLAFFFLLLLNIFEYSPRP